MNTNYLEQVQEGMRVFDRLHHEIGTVDYVKMSDDDPSTPEVEAAEPYRMSERRETFLDAVADVFRSDDLPEAVCRPAPYVPAVGGTVFTGSGSGA